MKPSSAMPDDYAPPGEHARAIIVIAICTLLLLGLSIGALWGVFRWQVPPQRQIVPAAFPGPSVLRDQAVERDRLLARHRIELDSYAWVDRSQQIVAVPIDRAMDLLSARGAAAYDPLIQQPDSSTGDESGSSGGTWDPGAAGAGAEANGTAKSAGAEGAKSAEAKAKAAAAAAKAAEAIANARAKARGEQ